jgi:hypothetical protein
MFGCIEQIVKNLAGMLLNCSSHIGGKALAFVQ